MNMRLKTVASVVLLALVAGCAAGRGPCDGAEPAIRVGTYNIRYSNGDVGTPNAWQQRKDDLVALVKRLDLDIAGLQEVCPDQLSYLRGKLPGFEFVGEHRNADRTTGEASPVMYRKGRFDAEKAGTFWLSETPDVPGVKGWGAACPRVCSYAVLRDRRTGRRLCFANTHTDHRSAEAREKGMRLIIERMREFGNGCPIVFTGDHNCRETEDPAIAVSKLLNNALYESKTPPSGSWRTFNGWQWRDEEFSTAEALKLDKSVRNARTGSPDGERLSNGMHAWELCGARIDYVYVSPGVRVLDYATVSAPRPEGGLYPSDHFPIVATIEVPGVAASGESGDAPLRMQNIAHRGMWDKCVPQNTVEAIRRAYESGATWVETDFHHTKAGQMVCIHAERELERYTGCRKKIADLSPEDVATLDLGSRDGLGRAYRMPLLAQVLAVVPSNGVLQAEIKGYSPEYADIFDNAVRKAGLSEKNIVVSSFKYGALKDFKARYPQYRTAWLVSLPKGKAFDVSKWIAKAKDAGFEVFCPGCGTTRGVMTRADADAVRAAGLEFRMFGVNSRDDLEQAKALGAAGFTCNFWREAFAWADDVGGVELVK